MIEDVIVTEAWSAVDADQRSDVRFQVTEDAVVCLEGLVLAGRGVGEGRETIV